MEPDAIDARLSISRRHFLSRSTSGLGALALAHLVGRDAFAQEAVPHGLAAAADGGLHLPHFAPKAKRVIYLFQSGAPSQMDLFDFKPAIQSKRGLELPDSVRMGQRITTMTSGQKNLFRSRRAFSNLRSTGRAERGSANCSRIFPASPTTSASSAR
jgi:hypothetical protein